MSTGNGGRGQLHSEMLLGYSMGSFFMLSSTSSCTPKTEGKGLFPRSYSTLARSCMLLLSTDLSPCGRGSSPPLRPNFRFQIQKDRHATPRSRGAGRPRFCKNRSRLDKQRAQGKPGGQCTRSLACETKKHTSVVTTGSPEQTRPSLRKGDHGHKKRRQFKAMRLMCPPLCRDLLEQ